VKAKENHTCMICHRAAMAQPIGGAIVRMSGDDAEMLMGRRSGGVARIQQGGGIGEEKDGKEPRGYNRRSDVGIGDAVQR
jgi:hypothetical protein